MARPRKNKEDQKITHIKVRASEAEKSALKSKAFDANLSPSDFVRKKLFGSTAQTNKIASPDRTAVIKAVYYLGKLINEVRENRQKGEDDVNLERTLVTLSKDLIKYLDGDTGKIKG